MSNPASPGTGRKLVSKHCPWHRTGTNAQHSPSCPEVMNAGQGSVAEAWYLRCNATELMQAFTPRWKCAMLSPVGSDYDRM